MKNILILLSGIRLIPHCFFFLFHNKRKIIKYDVKRWLKLTDKSIGVQWGFLTLMTFNPEYRNLFYKRIGRFSVLINWLCPKMNTLFIATNHIGPGLFIQHGFATIIAAKSIGRDCWVNQQVTIGYSNKNDCPELGDNVTINAGAKIIGNLKMGNNSIVGANAVVTKNVPDNCTVVGIPAHIIRKNGVRVNEKL